MILKTLDVMGPLHGYGLARRLEQVSDQVLRLNEGTVYTSLLRLQQQELDLRQLGHLGEQSARQVLRHHRGWQAAARPRDRAVEPDLGCHRARAPSG